MSDVQTDLTALRDELLDIGNALRSRWGLPITATQLERAADRLTAALGSLPPQEKAPNEAAMGHVRLDECAGSEATRGLPLYDRISAKIEQLVHDRDEVQHMLTASGHEMDILRSRASAAEHRRAAAEYRAQRIVLDEELRQENSRLKAELAALGSLPVPEKLKTCASCGVEALHPDDECCRECWSTRWKTPTGALLSRSAREPPNDDVLDYFRKKQAARRLTDE